MDRDTKEAAKPRLAAANRVAKAAYVPLRDSKRPHVDDDLLKKLKITRKRLDLSGGNPSDCAEQFIEPINPEVMQEWLRCARGKREDLSPPMPDGTFFNDDYMEAMFLIIMALQHLQESYDEDGFGPDILQTRTQWTELM